MINKLFYISLKILKKTESEYINACTKKVFQEPHKCEFLMILLFC